MAAVKTNDPTIIELDVPDETHLKKSRTRRVQMDLNDRDFDRLNKLKEISEAGSYTEVLKDALRLYEFIITKDVSGSKFYVEEGNGEMVRLEFFGLKA
ncbi:MAG: hypothetical protein ABJ388_11295 [Alphaproteobacteria bacterium]|uniref:hypothetical protein n=1 Tax=Nisaea sp. TaxID=2024842 RepID=UPI003266B135